MHIDVIDALKQQKVSKSNTEKWTFSDSGNFLDHCAVGYGLKKMQRTEYTDLPSHWELWFFSSASRVGIFSK